MIYLDYDPSNFNWNLSRWNVSNVKTMELMFYGIKTLNSDISSWNIENVCDMSWMLSGASSFNHNIIKNWDLSNIK